jgi:hypothetical protein
MTTLSIRPKQVEYTLPYLRIDRVFDSQTAQPSLSLDCETGSSESNVWYAFHPTTGELVEIDPEQLWFWTPEWLAGERMVEEDLRLGRYEEFDDMDDFLATL